MSAPTNDERSGPGPMDIFETAYTNRWGGSALGAHPGAAGKTIMGFLDTGFPEEIALAAGMVPVLLTGDPHGTTAATEGHVDRATPGRARQLNEGFLTGRYDFADTVTITGGDRYLANTYGFLDAYQQASGQTVAKKLFYLERARGTYREHRDFNRDRMALFRHALAAHTGTAIDDDALSEAIAVINRSRRLLQRLAQARVSTPGVVSGTQAVTIQLASMLMPKQDFNAALETLLDDLPQQTPETDRPKVFVTGSPVDHIEVHQALETAGALVVAENMEFAGRYDHTLVREDIDPLEALADRYTYKYPDAWGFGRDRRISWNLKTARQSGADAVLFFHTRYDSSTGWDYPDLRAGLQRQEIPTFAVPDQPYLMGEEHRFAARIAEIVNRIDARKTVPAP